MKAFGAWIIAAGLLFTPALPAQHEEHGEQAAHGESHSNVDLWKWANFLILAGVLGYFIGKNGGPFFRSRLNDIRKGITDAEQSRAEAEARSAEVERRLANLGSEIEELRRAAREEAASEGERVRLETGRRIAKIQAQAEQEIAATAKAARTELKRYAAELSVGMARQKIRERIGPESQDALVDSFVQGLEKTRNGGRAS
ncbi:MAG: ATP synthase F0 subunit B [Bryobacterales bacterium]|nr:ATP synthase F0 subunit B [Bryobacterales bacterium]